MTAWAHQGAAREPTDAKKFRPGAGENFGQRCGEITWSFVERNATFHSPDGDRALAYVTVPTHSKLPYAVPCRSNATPGPARAQQRDTNSAGATQLY